MLLATDARVPFSRPEDTPQNQTWSELDRRYH